MAISQNLRGIGAIVLATGAFVANDTCMKLALSDAPPFQVLVMRGIAACLWCMPIVFAMGLIRELPKAFNPWVVLRSFSEVVRHPRLHHRAEPHADRRPDRHLPDLAA